MEKALTSIASEPKQDWSLSEWIANFFREDFFAFDEDYYTDDMYDDTIGGSGDDYEDDGIVESFLIIGVTMSLLLMLWWRQRMQQNHARDQNARQREQQQQQQQQQQQGQVQPAQQDGRPDLGDAFPGWAAGGMGL